MLLDFATFFPSCDLITSQGIIVRITMKHRIAIVLLLVAAPVFFATAAQSDPSKEAAPQVSHENLSSNSNRATSHDRHMRKHRSGSHRHRPRTTSKTNPH
jgi:hypothetical protein